MFGTSDPCHSVTYFRTSLLQGFVGAGYVTMWVFWYTGKIMFSSGYVTKKEYETSVRKPEVFWAKIAGEFVWRKKWKQLMSGTFEKGTSRWFVGAQLNITENCLDRHLEKHADDVALLWEPNNPKQKGKSLSYRELHAEVCRMANVLKKYRVQKGDHVCIYMPMIPEAVVAMLACARIGAIHNVVFAGFSAQSLADRMRDSNCRVVITSDVGFRGDKKINIQKNVIEAAHACPKLKNILVFFRERTRTTVKDEVISLNDELASASADHVPVIVRASDPLFVLYTSGSTGKPKGILHAVGGYMVYAGYTFRTVFGYRSGEVFWCTADLGWITGHTYGVYGPMLNRATVVLFEGVPTFPTPSRYWEVIEKYKVNIFYTAPTVIRSLESFGVKYVRRFRLASLRLLGSVGEPLNSEAWQWYYRYVGKKKCRIVDTWWQTETGGIMISPQSNVASDPGSVGLPLPGVVTALLSVSGKEIRTAEDFGLLCIKKPWPGMAVGILHDTKRFYRTYFSAHKGYYLTGDVARRDNKGQYHIFGRSDDVINVSGHRLGSAEIESAINTHPDAVESSVVARSHPITGTEVYAFVILQHKRLDEQQLKKELREVVRKVIGPIAVLGEIQVVNNLPKTRSGKIVRRILRRLASGESCENEDVTTLVDAQVIEEIQLGLCRSS